MQNIGGVRRPEPGRHKHILCRAAELDYADINAALHAIDQRIQQKIREQLSFAGALFLLVQLDAQAQDARHHTRIAAGITDKVLTMADVAALVDAREQSQIQKRREALLASPISQLPQSN